MASISDLKNAVADVVPELSESLTRELIAQGLAPMEILEEGIMEGLSELGDRFASKKAIVLDLVKGGIIAKSCIPLVEAEFPAEREKTVNKKIVLGTMLSQHNIGKNLVGTLLAIGGFDVIDIGEKKEPWDFYEQAKKADADIIAVSVVFGPAMQKCDELLSLLQEMNVRDKYPVIVGGAVTNEKWARDLGADGWGAQAKDAVTLSRNLLGIAAA